MLCIKKMYLTRREKDSKVIMRINLIRFHNVNSKYLKSLVYLLCVYRVRIEECFTGYRL